MQNYLDLIRGYPRQLSFGWLHSFFSNLGHTWFLSIFVPHIRETFELQRSEFGTLFSAAILADAVLLPTAGRLVDRFNLRLYSMTAGLSLVAACWIMASAGSLPFLFLGIFGLRLFGFSILTQIESISISRYFGKRRGMALGISSLGSPLGTAVFPIIGSFLIMRFSWQESYFLMSFLCVLVFLPLSVLLLRKEDDFQHPPGTSPRGRSETASVPQMGRRDVLRSPYFYFVLPVLVIPVFILNGLIFHQGSLAAYKNWRPGWIASFFVMYGIAQSLASFGMGPMIDRLSAKVFLPFYLFPMGLGLIVLATMPGFPAGAICFGMIGLSMGGGRTVKSAIWAEVYGTRHLGAIRGLYFSLAVFAGALTPALFGWFLDLGMDINTLLLSGAALIAAASFLSFVAPEPGKAAAGS